MKIMATFCQRVSSEPPFFLLSGYSFVSLSVMLGLIILYLLDSFLDKSGLYLNHEKHEPLAMYD